MTKLDNDKIKTAGLTQAEVGGVLGVSRMTLYNWRKKGVEVSVHLAEKVARFNDLLEKLLERGSLPLKPDLDKDARKAKIDKLKSIFEQF